MSDPAPDGQKPHFLFDRAGWWDGSCRDFGSLRAISTFRLELLRRWLPFDLDGRTIIDLGCGGGLMAVPLARRGARVIGVDLARGAVQAAHAQQMPTLQPVVADLGRAPVADACADLVLLADVLEHLSNPAGAVLEAARMLRPGGHLFINTIHRTLRSRLLAVALGEGLGFIPRGTHRWQDFVKPDELDDMARAARLLRTHRTGASPRWLATVRQRAIVLRPCRSLAVGYAALFQKIRV